MFCDLGDSTGISAKLDAEERRDLVGASLDAASAAVTEMGGKVAKRLGDGLMALFGYRLRRRTMPSEPCVQHHRSSLRLPKREEHRELLAPVYGWFTEGFDTRDLREAKALLASCRREPPRFAARDAL